MLKENVHPAAQLFPLLSDTQLQTIVESMRGGYDPAKPILRYAGQILDGRNRLRAAELAGVNPIFADVPDDCDPYLESWKHNGARRDLEAAQRVAIKKLIDLRSGEWQRERDARHRKANEGRTGRPKKGVAKSPPSHEGRLTHPNATSIAANMAKQTGVSRATVERVEMVAGTDESKLHALASGKVKLADAVREHRRAAVKAKLEDVGACETKAVQGVFDVLVIDPPWPMEKIERDERPNQSELDYPTMSEGELAALTIPCADPCHVWLWTTQRFLPMALRLLGAWDLKYICTFVWHKPGGFQPIGLPQYNCEFALYARRGSPPFLDTKAFSTCFEAPRGKHSVKPEAFYDVVRRVTAGRRLDMFNRRLIDGFEGWGKEAA